MDFGDFTEKEETEGGLCPFLALDVFMLKGALLMEGI